MDGLRAKHCKPSFLLANAQSLCEHGTDVLCASPALLYIAAVWTHVCFATGHNPSRCSSNLTPPLHPYSQLIVFVLCSRALFVVAFFDLDRDFPGRSSKHTTLCTSDPLLDNCALVDEREMRQQQLRSPGKRPRSWKSSSFKRIRISCIHTSTMRNRQM